MSASDAGNKGIYYLERVKKQLSEKVGLLFFFFFWPAFYYYYKSVILNEVSDKYSSSNTFLVGLGSKQLLWLTAKFLIIYITLMLAFLLLIL